jgi:hypothetical protein
VCQCRLQNDDDALVAAAAVSQIREGEKKRTVGAWTFAIDKLTGELAQYDNGVDARRRLGQETLARSEKFRACPGLGRHRSLDRLLLSENKSISLRPVRRLRRQARQAR